MSKRGKRRSGSKKPRYSSELRLSSITDGMPGLTPVRAAAFVEAARVCLDDQSQRSGCVLTVAGHIQREYTLRWRRPSLAQKRTYADESEATEEGAVAIAVAVVTDATEYLVVERSVKKTGIDYWLGRRAGLFEARLEVSGIRRGTQAQIRARMKTKQRQMIQSDARGVPGYAVVVEFSNPIAQINEK